VQHRYLRVPGFILCADVQPFSPLRRLFANQIKVSV
jgi:hypothetical protein